MRKHPRGTNGKEVPEWPSTVHTGWPDGSEEFVSRYPDFGNGWQVGSCVVTSDDEESANSLYSVGGDRAAKFGHARLDSRSGAGRIPAMIRVSEDLQERR